MRWDNIYQGILRDVVEGGDLVAAAPSASVGSDRESLERLNYCFVLDNPRDRLLWNPARNLNVYRALARFFWMLAGNDRVKDIAFYEPRVTLFSDDSLTVPGSNYGKRLLMPEPGLNQIESIIDRIQKDPGTRRAAAAIYRPEDASRTSRDIPCAFGLAFHPRGGRLHMTMIMRSNAAWGLLPYNVFEFTLLGELVSSIARIPLGNYTHFALSMHVYRGTAGKPDEVDNAKRAAAVDLAPLPPPMPPMPPTTFADLRQVTEWEAELRYASSGINVTNYRDYIHKCRDRLAPYWIQLSLPLLAYALLDQKKITLALTVLEQIEEPLRQALMGDPLLKALSVPGLEDDPILLESRLNLMRYALDEAMPEDRRELLWRGYRDPYIDAAGSASPSERRRQSALSVREWRERDRSAGQPELSFE